MGVKTNIIYSIILTTSTYVIQLVTFPYLSRVLGVENIGIVNFIDSIVNYFVMFSMLGLNILGIREIAKTSNDSNKRNRVFSILFSINLFLTITLLVIYGGIIYFVPQLYENRELLFLGAFKLFFNLFLIEWFYKGIEDFKYITMRTLALRFVYIISLFIFVKNSTDTYIYYAITVLLVIFNAIINWMYSNKRVLYKWVCVKDVKLFIKSYAFLGLYLILTSAYTTFNVIYLGFVCSEKEVGYYVTALKIYTIILGLFTSLTNVMMPRMSALLSEGNLTEFERKINKSFLLFFSISVPLIFAVIPLSNEIVDVIAGVGYERAVLPMQIIMPLIVIVGIAQVLAVQVLIPLRKDNVILRVAIIGAAIGLSLNLILVNRLGSVGTAITLLCSELSVTFLFIFYMYKNRILFIPITFLIQNILYSVPYVFFVVILKNILYDNLWVILFSLIICGIYFILSQLFFIKNSVIISFLKTCLKYK